MATGDLVEVQITTKSDIFVYTLGDNAYQNGKHSEFINRYDPTWSVSGGGFLSRTHPALGNHEYAGRRCHEQRGPHGTSVGCATNFFALLYQAKAGLVLSGHNHIYEWLTDINVQGTPVAEGIDQFVVGQGGHDHDPFTVVGAGKFPPPAGSVDIRYNTRSGVLKLTLGANGYDWQYLGVPGGSAFTDGGSERIFR